MAYAPTPEQADIIQAAATGENLTVVAGAGAGKTSTLQFLAAAYPQRRGLYLAFNKAIKMDAERKFSGMNVHASTIHALAYRTHGAPFRDRMNTSRRTMPWHEKADILGIDDGIELPEIRDQRKRLKVSRQIFVGVVGDAVTHFYKHDLASLDDVDVHARMPEEFVEAATEQELDAAVAQVREWMGRMWADLTDPDGGQLPFQHDVYVKLWALSNPVLPYDVIYFDEAQDADALVLGVLKRQPASTQIIAVGDEAQQIYGWRGAVNGMSSFDGRRLPLTQSFRFGDAIAQEANFWLDGLGADIRVRGLNGKPSRVGRVERPDAVLTRSNAGSIEEIIRGQDEGRRVHIAGEQKARELLQIAEACNDLVAHGRTRHRDFRQFSSWEQVVDYAESGEAADLAPIVRLVDQVGAPRLKQAIQDCVPADQADLTVSTAHVSKGLEWESVRIGDDFFPPGTDEETGLPLPISVEMARLCYVAVTRAKTELDMRGLLWVRGYEGGFATEHSSTVRSAPAGERTSVAADAKPSTVSTSAPSAFQRDLDALLARHDGENPDTLARLLRAAASQLSPAHTPSEPAAAAYEPLPF